LSLHNEAAAAAGLRDYLASVLAGFSTTIAADEAELASQPPPPYRRQMALRYRLTRKRIAAQQAAWADALLPVVRLCAARVPAMREAGPMQADLLDDTVARYVGAVAATTLAELRATHARTDEASGRRLSRQSSGGSGSSGGASRDAGPAVARDRDAAMRGE
jgi:uncharacterized membrane protein YgcG